MNLSKLDISDCFILHGFKSFDSRGWFLKSYRQDYFNRFGLEFNCRETFFTYSDSGVLRGMHFQLPPKAHAKLVTCISGRVIDVLLDLRKNSPDFGKSIGVELSAAKPDSIFVPVGVAHGFAVSGDHALMAYQTSEPYDPELDSGLLWSSFNYNWPNNNNPIISSRDLNLPKLIDFNSPF